MPNCLILKLRKPCQEIKSRFKEYNAVYTRLVRAARKNTLMINLKNIVKIVNKHGKLSIVY